jgi:perosamine synthetase
VSSGPLSINDLIVRQQDDIGNALRVLDQSALGVAFAVDNNGCFAGTLHAADLESVTSTDASLASAMPQPVKNGTGATIAPVLDRDNKPVDFTSPGRSRRVAIAEPDLSGNEKAYVTECLDTNWISSQGEFVRRFERDFAARLGVPHALAVSNGTVALHLALVAFGIGPDDEVIVPELTFAATINTVLYVGAKPVIVDVDPKTWNICPEATAAAITSKTKAIMPVHLYGQPADMDALNALAKKHNLVIIEDAAEAIGAKYKGTPCGAVGDSGCFSFFSNKLLTTGEGGMVVFKDDAVAERARRLRDHGMDPAKRYWHNEVGFNYRLTNLQAAIGCAQLERLDDLFGRKMAIADQYKRRLASIPEITLPANLPGLTNSHWMISIVVDFAALGIGRLEFMQRLAQAGIETRPLFYPLHEMPPYKPFAGNTAYPVTDHLSANGLSLPSGVLLQPAEVDYVCDVIENQIRTRRLMRRFALR